MNFRTTLHTLKLLFFSQLLLSEITSYFKFMDYYSNSMDWIYSTAGTIDTAESDRRRDGVRTK